MVFNHDGYKRAIEGELTIVNKSATEIPLVLNKAQADFLRNISGRDVILKARQLGFSTLILALFTIIYLFKENQRLVVVSHESQATQRLMDRVKFFIAKYEEKNKIKIPTKYNSRSELVNESNNSTFYIGTAESKSFGRGDTITGLHLSEFAFYPDAESIFTGVLQALTPDGLCFIETTANGFNYFKGFWDDCVLGTRPFKTHFYNPEWEYSPEFLEEKRGQLKRLFSQEYPMTPEEAFLTSGSTYFDTESLKAYLNQVREPIHQDLIYV